MALPELVGPRIAGLPADDDGYLRSTSRPRVGCHDVYAAGDATAFPIKHGGLAAQQADALAEAIAARPARSAIRSRSGRSCARSC